MNLSHFPHTKILLLCLVFFVFSATIQAKQYKVEYFSILGSPASTRMIAQELPNKYLIERPGSTFRISLVSPITVGATSIDTLTDPTSPTPIKITWNHPAKNVSIYAGDDQPDIDNVNMRAFDCFGQQIGQTSVTVPASNVPIFRQMQINKLGICSIELIGGSANAPQSVVYAGLSISTNDNPASFDIDNVADFTTYRPNGGFWWSSVTQTFGYPQLTQFAQWGASSDIPVPADYDGYVDDNYTAEYAVFRNGIWYLADYYSTSPFPGTVSIVRSFGIANDIPVPADYDNDNKADLAVFRPTTGVWYIWRSSDNQVSVVQFGANGDIPVQGNYDDDGKTDIAVFRPSTGVWYILQSATNSYRILQFGQNGDKPIPADYDGDGQTDIGIYRQGTWWILNSHDSSLRVQQFGLSSDLPVPADYNDNSNEYNIYTDGKANLAVFRPANSTWYVLTSGGLFGFRWGADGDKPISFLNSY